MAQKSGFLRQMVVWWQKSPYFEGCKNRSVSKMPVFVTLCQFFSLFFQQVFHVCVVTLFALLVKEDDERDAAEIEFL